MTPEQFALFYILKNQHMPFEERFSAAQEIGREVLLRRIGQVNIPLYYPLMVNLWRSLDSSKTDSYDERLFDIRKVLANVCQRLSFQSTEGQKIFKYFPRVKRAEGKEDRVYNKMIQGARNLERTVNETINSPLAKFITGKRERTIRILITEKNNEFEFKKR